MKTILFGFILTPFFIWGANWPQWRGPNSSGHAPKGINYPSVWSAEKNILWKTNLPGRGHSSPVHDGKHLGYHRLETPASEEEKKERLKQNNGIPTVTVLSKVSLRALKIDPATGKILKNIEIFEKKQPQWVHKLNSYASPSPFLEKGKLYLHFGAYGNACIDSESGKISWKNQEKNLWVMHENGRVATHYMERFHDFPSGWKR